MMHDVSRVIIALPCCANVIRVHLWILDVGLSLMTTLLQSVINGATQATNGVSRL